MNFKKIIQTSPAFVLPAVINLITLLILTRVLSLEDYGKLSLALITIEFSQGFIFQWIKLAMVRFYDERNKIDSITIVLHFSLLFCLLLALVFLFSFIPYFHFIDKTYISFIILGIVGRSFCYLMLDYIRMTNENFKKYTIISLISNMFYFVPAIAYVFFATSPQINSILGIQTISVSVYMISVLIYKYKTLIYAFKNFKKVSEYKEFIKYGVPLILVFLASSAFVRIDRFIIEHNLGLAQLGVYSAAYSFSNLAISSFFSIITLPTYPEIIRKLNTGEVSVAQKIYRNNGNIFLLCGVLLVLGCFYFNNALTTLFFGNKGKEIALIFPYVALGTFLLNFKTHFFDQIFQFAKRTQFLMYLGLFFGVCHFILSYYLSTFLGSKGVAISVSLLNTCAIVFIYFYSQTFFKITFNVKIMRLVAGLIITYLASKAFNYFN